ncbi:MAG: hypothetical protein P4L62_00510 [Candidatus Pacebacteria bacterium]|nr:hypothetical protein [Candidatus Paceibacterota bacterium]MDR3582831.1 hypothetical protein [Candidatus Paceibacterota bacterium]
MFDLTKEVALESSLRKWYRFLQLMLYLLGLIAAVFLAYLILFPHKNYNYSFSLDPSSSKNSISQPIVDKQLSADGKTEAGNVFGFDASVFGYYSRVTVNLTLNGDSNPLKSPILNAQKSYKAFLFDVGDPVGFRDGSLLMNNNKFYIVSDNQLRQFSNAVALSGFGYIPQDFIYVPTDELKYNPIGPVIATADSYPDDTIFRIADNYYILKNGTLEKFVSDQAFTTQYDPRQALAKDANFLQKFPLSKDLASFIDGTLVSNGGSVYIVSGNNLLPVNDPTTFITHGYLWDKVLPVGEDEIANYPQTKLFKISDPNPDGTVFATQDSSQYYLIRGNQKHLLPGPDIAHSWFGKNAAIPVSQNDSRKALSCNLKKNLFTNTYSCNFSIDSFTNFPGTDFVFKLSNQNAVRINSINLSFTKDINRTNLISSLSGLLNQARNNYEISKPSPSAGPVQTQAAN